MDMNTHLNSRPCPTDIYFTSTLISHTILTHGTDSSRQQHQHQHTQQQQIAQSRRKIVMQNDGLYHVHSNDNGDKQYTPLDLEELENMSHGQIIMPNSPLHHHPTPRGIGVNTNNKGVDSQSQLPQQSQQQFQPMAAWGPGQRPANLFNGDNNTTAPLMAPPPPPPPQQPMLSQSRQQQHEYPQQQYNQQPNNTMPPQQQQQQQPPLSPHHNHHPHQMPINNSASYKWDSQNLQRFLDMRAEMLAVLVVAACPTNTNNSSNNNNNGGIRGGRDMSADMVNAYNKNNNNKAGVNATLRQQEQLKNEQQQQQQSFVRSHSDQLPTSPTRPNDDINLDASNRSSANKSFIRAATTGAVRPSADGEGGGPSMMPDEGYFSMAC